MSLTYGFKSRLPHQVKELANPLFIRVCEFFCFMTNCVLVIVWSLWSKKIKYVKLIEQALACSFFIPPYAYSPP